MGKDSEDILPLTHQQPAPTKIEIETSRKIGKSSCIYKCQLVLSWFYPFVPKR